MAARLLYNPERGAAAGSDDALADAKAGGMDEQEISRLAARLNLQAGFDREGFAGVWPQHEAAVRAAEAASTQWRTTVSFDGERLVTRFTGLDYAGCAAAWAALGIALSLEAFRQFQFLESCIRTLLNGGELTGGAA